MDMLFDKSLIESTEAYKLVAKTDATVSSSLIPSKCDQTINKLEELETPNKCDKTNSELVENVRTVKTDSNNSSEQADQVNSTKLVHSVVDKNNHSKKLQAPGNISIGESLLIRPLSIDDYNKNYLGLLEKLTQVGSIDEQQFREKFNRMKSTSGVYYIVVVEDTAIDTVVATASLIIEEKFIRNASQRGRIEDVVVLPNYRGYGLAKLTIQILVDIAFNHENCYKITLECLSTNIPFYKKFGFNTDDQNYMCLRK